MKTFDELAAQQAGQRAAIEALYAGVPQAWVPAITGSYAGYYGHADDAEFSLWLDNELEPLLAQLAQDADDPVTFHPLLVEFAPYGVHYVDKLFGAEVYQQDGLFWSRLLSSDPGSLPRIDLERAALLEWTIAALSKLLIRLPTAVAATIPIFSSPLNVAINLYGEEMLMALSVGTEITPHSLQVFSPPAFVAPKKEYSRYAFVGASRHTTKILSKECKVISAPTLSDPEPRTLQALEHICQVIVGLHQRLRLSFPTPRLRFYCSCSRWAPDDVGHICGCSTQLLSAESYARYFAPLDARVLDVYPHGGTIHLCGRHTQHINCWQAMPKLRAVQLNDAASDEFAAYYSGLRNDQLIYITPTEYMTVERILEISGGKRVILQAVCQQRIEVSG